MFAGLEAVAEYLSENGYSCGYAVKPLGVGSVPFTQWRCKHLVEHLARVP